MIVFAVPIHGYGKRVKPEIEKVDNYEDLYFKGKQAYLENDYKDCIKHIEAAVEDYRMYTSTVNKCKLECQNNNKNIKSVMVNSPHLEHYEKMIKVTLCIMKCKIKTLGLGRTEEIKSTTLEDFSTKKPYDYLQLCYYQENDVSAASNAAYTFQVYNPDHQITKDNIDFYLKSTGAEIDDLINLEAPKYVTLYFEALETYRKEEWAETAETMEESLKLFLHAEEECRVECEKPFDMGWFPDFVSSIANHFTFCLKCKRNCGEIMKNFNGEYMEDVVSSFYNYLQFSYYQIGKIEEAAKASVSFLKFIPDHESMNNNVEYYREMEDVEEGWFQPRKEVVEYLAREWDEVALLDFIEKSFVFGDMDEKGDRLTVAKLEEQIVKEADDDDEDKDEEHEEVDLAADEFIAEWSEDDEEYVIQDKSEMFSDDYKVARLSPPPIVKFEL